MTRPLLFGGTGNENLTFAPYHTHYPMLDAHMLMSGLTPKINEWNNPLLLGKLMFPARFFFGKLCQGKAKKVSANSWLPLFHSAHTFFFGVLTGHDDESHVFKEMDPGAFFTFSIPFDMKGKTKVSIG